MNENNLENSKIGYVHREVNIFNDKKTKSKIDKHLLDINDTISEDDIRNIKVAFPGFENNTFPSLNKPGTLIS